MPAAIALLIPDAAKCWAANAAPGSTETLAVGALAMTALMVASRWFRAQAIVVLDRSGIGTAPVTAGRIAPDAR